MAELLTTLDAVMLEYAAATGAPPEITVTVTPAETTADGHLVWTFTATVTVQSKLRVVAAPSRGGHWQDPKAELDKIAAQLVPWRARLHEAADTTTTFLHGDG